MPPDIILNNHNFSRKKIIIITVEMTFRVSPTKPTASIIEKKMDIFLDITVAS